MSHRSWVRAPQGVLHNPQQQYKEKILEEARHLDDAQRRSAWGPSGSVHSLEYVSIHVRAYILSYPQMHRHLPHVRRGGPKPKLRKVKMHSTFLPSLPGGIHIDLQLSVMDVSVRSARECLAQRARSSHAQIEIGVPFSCCADACLFLSGTIGLQVVASWGARRCWQWFYCQQP